MRLIGLMFLTAVLYAGDLSGKWLGTSEFTNRGGEVRSGPILMMLKQSGEEVTGTAGPTAERQQEIRGGKVSGDKFTFELTDAGGKVVVEMTAGEGSLKGEAKMHREYGVITMKMELKRAPAAN
jgi:hypothetical protein